MNCLMVCPNCKKILSYNSYFQNYHCECGYCLVGTHNDSICLNLYAVKDKATGKLINDITNPKRKFWEKKGSAESAIRNYQKSYYGKVRNYKPEDLELVTLLCNEVKE